MSWDQVLPHFSERGTTPQKVMLVLQREGNAQFFQALLGECQHATCRSNGASMHHRHSPRWS